MVYLDNAATTPVKFPSENDYWFNANTPYAKVKGGSYDKMKKCANRIKQAMGVKGKGMPGEVVFGGETTLLMLQPLDYMRESNLEIWVSPYEHDSVYCLNNDVVSYSELLNEDINCEDKIYAHMPVNNVTGQKFDCEAIGKRVRELGGYYLCDATAMVGKEPIPTNVQDWCDIFVCSGHKFYAPKGVGFMWLSDRFLNKILYSWQKKEEAQEYFWPGTPDVPNILALTKAFEIANDKDKMAERHKAWDRAICVLDHSLWSNHIDHEFVTADNGKFNNAICALRINGVNADALQMYLATKDIYIGLGHSACAGEGDYTILKQYGLTEAEAEEIVRLSFGYDVTDDDVLAFTNGVIDFKKKFVIA